MTLTAKTQSNILGVQQSDQITLDPFEQALVQKYKGREMELLRIAEQLEQTNIQEVDPFQLMRDVERTRLEQAREMRSQISFQVEKQKEDDYQQQENVIKTPIINAIRDLENRSVKDVIRSLSLTEGIYNSGNSQTQQNQISGMYSASMASNYEFQSEFLSTQQVRSPSAGTRVKKQPKSFIQSPIRSLNRVRLESVLQDDLNFQSNNFNSEFALEEQKYQNQDDEDEYDHDEDNGYE